MSDSYHDEILEWRQTQEDDLLKDVGWLTLAGLHWLKPGLNTLGTHASCDVVLPEGSAPELFGFIALEGTTITLKITADERVLVEGEPVQTVMLRADPYQPTRVAYRALTWMIIERSGQYAVRVWDRHHPNRVHFQGRRWYTIKPDYRIEGKFVPHPAPRTLEVENIVGLITAMPNPGYVEFPLNGQTFRLEAFEADERRLWFVFKDLTSGQATYGLGRFLYSIIQDKNTVIMDFNCAYNPPCIFTPYATCPIPLKENHLPMAIEAGELLPNTPKTS